MHILVVEDSAACAHYYSQYLQACVDQLSKACSLAEARRLLQDPACRPVNGVILDQFLADGLGLELMPCLRKLWPQAGVVMVSANDNPAFWLEAFEQGIDDYLIKPANMALLWVKLRRCIEQKAKDWAQQQELNRRIETERQEQILAKQLFDYLTRSLSEQPGFMRSQSLSQALFNGDLILHQQASDGSWYLLLADAMGHGLAAAVSLMPVWQIFQTMSRKALPLMELVLELNDKLECQLPDDRFVAAMLIHLQPAQNRLSIWNGGMPPAILYRFGLAPEFVNSDNLPLGILSQTASQMLVTERPLAEIQRILAFSDGVTESQNGKGECLSYSQVAQFGHPELSRGFDALRALVQQNLSQDDASLLEIDCQVLLDCQ